MQETIDRDVLLRASHEAEDSVVQTRARLGREQRRLIEVRTNLAAALAAWQRGDIPAPTPTQAAQEFCRQQAAERAAAAAKPDDMSVVDRMALDAKGNPNDPNGFARRRMRNGGFRRGGLGAL
jgi:hypothetical protein